MKRIVLSIYVCLLLSCGSNRAPQETEAIVNDTTVFHTAAQGYIADLVRTVEYVPLELSDESIYAEITKMIIKDDRIFICDKHNAKIVVFDIQGNFLYAINRRGHGPQEYVEMVNFTVGDNKVYTLDNVLGKVNIYKADNGEFVEKKELPIVAWDIAFLTDGQFLLATSPVGGHFFSKKQSRHRVFLTDADFKIKKRLFGYGKTVSDRFGKPFYFSETDRHIVFNYCISDVFHIFDRQNQDKAMQSTWIDFGNRKVPIKQRENPHWEDRNDYVYLYLTPIVCGDYIAFDIIMNGSCETFVYDKKTGFFYSNDYENSYNGLLPPLTSYRDKFVSELSSELVYDELVNDGFVKASPVVEAHIKNDGTALVLYTLK